MLQLCLQPLASLSLLPPCSTSCISDVPTTSPGPHKQRVHVSATNTAPQLPKTGGKTEDFISAAKLFHRAKRQVKVPTYLVPATQKVGVLVVGCCCHMYNTA